jgi:hypothetical protein
MFARTFAASIEQNPLAVYSTALPCAPITSLIHQTFYDSCLAASSAENFPQFWPSILTIQAGSDDILSVSFSPDSTRMVSGS